MINARPDRPALLVTLGRNWWMVGVRGALAILFGALLLVRPATSLNLLVAFFGVYALLDGGWAIASALWVTRTWFTAWPVLFEGAVSVAVGGLALAWPLVPRELVHAVATWGVLTGILEITAAVRLPRRGAGYWLLATGGVFSLFLAVIILVLPHAGRPSVASILGLYALAFGALLMAAAFSLREALPPR